MDSPPELSDETKNCPKCNSLMPEWFLICTSCGYELFDRKQIIPPSERIAVPKEILGSNIYSHQCPKCHSINVSSVNAGLIIIHLILILITAGLWLLILIIWALVSPKRKGKNKCNNCGYEWG